MKRIFLLAALLATACGNAADNTPSERAASTPLAAPERAVEVSDERLAAVRDSVAKRVPELADSPIYPTPIEGMFEVSHGLSFAYITEDARYIIEGDLVDLEAGVALTEERRRGARKAVIEEYAGSAITFAPSGGSDDAHTVTVFTDIDCGYCRKLHQEMAEYNEAGIAIRYLFYPRSGPNTESFRKAEAVWCQSDRHAAMTAAKMGSNVRGEGCSTPVAEHLRAGQRLGLRGTPMMVLPDGEVVQGYVSAEVLAARLDNPPLADMVP